MYLLMTGWIYLR